MVSYRSVKYQTQPPAFIMLIEQDTSDGEAGTYPTFMWPLIIAICCVGAVALLVVLGIIYFKKWKRNILKSPHDRKITVFTGGRYK